MLWTIFIVLLVLWLVGAVGGVGGWIHLMLVAAAVVFLVALLGGRRTVP